MRLTMKQTALALALAGAFGAANATALNFVPTSNVDVVASSFGGTLLDSATTSISNFSYNGTARSAVYQTSTGLDFYYQFTNNASSKNGIERFTGYDFTSVNASTINVYQTGAAFGIFTAGTEQADYADRTNLGVIGFSFVPNGNSKINPGLTSFTEIVRTNATTYVPGNFGLIDGYGDNAKGFAPSTSPVPEPETYGMLMAGLALMGFVARRRTRKS